MELYVLIALALPGTLLLLAVAMTLIFGKDTAAGKENDLPIACDTSIEEPIEQVENPSKLTTDLPADDANSST